MYSQWINITERDLIHKGASYKKIKPNLTIEKVVLNMTLPTISSGLVGNKVQNNKGLKTKVNTDKVDPESFKSESTLNLSVMSLLAIISGQRPVLTKARKSIANWKIRENQVLGFKVTLRGKVAIEFLDKTVRFQNINEQDIFANTDNKAATRFSNKKQSASVHSGFPSGISDVTGSLRERSRREGNYSLQSLGNVSIGIKNMNLYPELDDFWLAQNIGQKSSQANKSSLLGLDLSLNFKKSKELSQVINYILRKSGGKSLVENYSKNIQSFPNFMKTNKYVLALKNILILRQLYLTSIGLYPQVNVIIFDDAEKK